MALESIFWKNKFILGLAEMGENKEDEGEEQPSLCTINMYEIVKEFFFKKCTLQIKITYLVFIKIQATR